MEHHDCDFWRVDRRGAVQQLMSGLLSGCLRQGNWSAPAVLSRGTGFERLAALRRTEGSGAHEAKALGSADEKFVCEDWFMAFIAFRKM